MPVPIPVTVLTGFLGAGKTTLLNRLLKDPALSDAAVVINEFGAVGIDHLLVEATGEDVVLMASGCLCCTIRGELVDTLTDLAARRACGTVPPFRRLVLETTGLADPVPILQTLMSPEGLAASFRLDGVVTVVDAVHGADTLGRNAESLRQVAVADRLLVAKGDLADKAALDELERRLRAINPSALILDAASASATEILGAVPFSTLAKSDEVREWLAADDVEAHPVHLHHRHDVNRHDASIRAFCLTADAPIQASRLEAFLDLLRERHGPDLLRMKAIVDLAEDPGHPLVLHAVQHVLHPLARLATWPTQDHRSRLVFIMRDTDPARIDDLFAAFLGHPRIDAPDAAALADNPLALR